MRLPDQLPTVTSADRLPYDEYTLAPRIADRLQDAVDELVRRCAADFGVDLTLVSEDPRATDDDSRMWNGRFGTLPLEQAREYGYHAPPGEPATSPYTRFTREELQPELEVIYAELGPEGYTLTNHEGARVPEGGCKGQVVRQLRGDPGALGPADADDLHRSAMLDPRTSDARSEWSACMAERGYAFQEIDDAADAALGQPLSEEEKTVAEADVLCTRASRWLDLSFAIEAELQRESIARHGTAYAQDLKDDIALARRAVRLAAEAGVGGGHWGPAPR